MATLIIDQLDADLTDRLALRAGRSGRTLEAEARAILAEALNDWRPAGASTQDWGTQMMAQRQRLGAGDASMTVEHRPSRQRQQFIEI